MTPEEHLKHCIEVSDSNLSMHQETKNISYKAIDNMLFVVSTGTLVISISFIGYIKTYIHWPWLLIASWFFLIISVAINYTGHKLMIAQSKRQIDLLNEERRNKFIHSANYDAEVVRKDAKMNEIILWGNRANTWGVIFLCLGLLSLLFFGGINLLAQNEINKQNQYPKSHDRLNYESRNYVKCNYYGCWINSR